jgi:hypothetical protein
MKNNVACILFSLKQTVNNLYYKVNELGELSYKLVLKHTAKISLLLVLLASSDSHNPAHFQSAWY